MKSEIIKIDPVIWRPQPKFKVVISSRRQLQDFNDNGGIAVFVDVARVDAPDIEISGSQNQALSFWNTHSISGFVTKPKFSAELLTIRFVTSGKVTYLRSGEATVASPLIATLASFDDLSEVRASPAFQAISATLSVDTIISANRALTGQMDASLPRLEPIAPMAAPGMNALFHSIQSIHRRLQVSERPEDLLLPLLQEVMSYQLLSAWPRRVGYKIHPAADPTSRQVRDAIEFIEANLPTALTLADVANAAGISVRSLQAKFKKELGRTPLQFIIERRLTRVHENLISTAAPTLSISDVARSWGFVHMADFSQRYRRLFGCTPSQTRAEIRRSRNFALKSMDT